MYIASLLRQRKKTVSFLMICLLSLSANADCYTNYEIKFAIETTDGNISIGYANVSLCIFDIDSIKNEKYVKERLILNSQNTIWSQNQKKDDFWYFQDRMEYEYKIWEEYEEKNTLYYLLNTKNIPITDIRTIKIESIIGKSAFMQISNDLQLNDTVWMKKEPIKRIGVGAYLCGHNIFVHVNSKEIDNIAKEIESKQKELDKIDINRENGDVLDDEIWEIVKELIKLSGQKVVIVSECSD